MLKKISNIKMINCLPLLLVVGGYRSYQNVTSVFPNDKLITAISISMMVICCHLVLKAIFIK
ncbi:Uncharacterised protein [Peptostreptococcus anaerobius]|uniref:Uncharacterized protein n=1 Tax=Peptostreptococcus anaerobius TaxID=1261 RepID=A0A379CCY2_9FIRM|nr:hypothetical protein [Peptostreptococcus anaerobius]SFM87562.1 hypothetical protein SAMN05660467_00671 [Peptostreptococcus anaerobius]SUB60183.1 Uncharacterised protein [Peptostreptococcus anaerobius]